MKTSKEWTKGGKRHVVVTLEKGEQLFSLKADESAMIVKDGSYYKLGGQLDEVVASHVLDATVPVTWCSVSQKWVE